MTDLSSLLVEYLENGHWWKIDQLARGLDASRRDIEAAIQEARLAGHPIVGSSLRGVRLSHDPAEILAYVEDREDRLRSVYAGTKALRETAERMRYDGTLGLTA